ncbi:hypothetical protein [Pseudoalteromonas sp.]|uniref:hypothetical protein n=1 Tax=Pseudoalteromonas sp. TaxID=53249 RepID=UPI003D13306B
MKKDDQSIFEAHCKEHLDLRHHLPIARKIYQDAYDEEPVEVKKKNKAGQAMNQYLLEQLKAKGWQYWRPDRDGKKPARVTPQKAGELTQEDRQAVAYKPKGEMPSEYSGKILRDAGL